MAKKELAHAFKKGQSGNPKGRPIGTTIIPREMKIMSARLISETIAKYLQFSNTELRNAIEDPTTVMLDLMILKIMYEAVRKGDQAKMNALFERMVGKVADKIDHSSSDGTMSPTAMDYSKLSKDELKKLEQIAIKLEPKRDPEQSS